MKIKIDTFSNTLILYVDHNRHIFIDVKITYVGTTITANYWERGGAGLPEEVKQNLKNEFNNIKGL